MDRWFRKTTPQEAPQTELEHPPLLPARKRFLPNHASNLRNLTGTSRNFSNGWMAIRSFFASFWPPSVRITAPVSIKLTVPWRSLIFLHTIKGMLRNLSMNSAAQTAAALEKSAQGGAEKESAELLLILEGDLAKILPEVEAQLVGVKA